MIYTLNLNTLSRLCREHWCCEYVITYNTVDGISDCEMMIGVML